MCTVSKSNCNVQAKDVSVAIQASKLPKWRRAARAVGTAHFLSKASQRNSSAAPGSSGNEEDSTEPSSTANASMDVPAVHHRCYKIPEYEATATGSNAEESSDGAEAGNNVHSWHNPLSAKKCHLPCNAKLDSNILEIGAKPDMKGCRFANRCKMKGKGAKAVPASEAPDAQHCPPPSQQSAAQESLRDKGTEER